MHDRVALILRCNLLKVVSIDKRPFATRHFSIYVQCLNIMRAIACGSRVVSQNSQFEMSLEVLPVSQKGSQVSLCFKGQRVWQALYQVDPCSQFFRGEFQMLC